MIRPDPYCALAQAIGQLLKEPISVTPAVAEFAASALGLTSPAEIAAVLTQGTTDDREQLLDLLLFPDEAAQVLLEPLLESLPLGNDAPARLLAAMKNHRPHLVLQLPDTGRQVKFTLPGDTLERYLSRLNPQRSLERETRTCIQQNLADSRQIAVKVAIRNHNLPADPRPWRLLRRFIAAGDAAAADYAGCLNMVLQLLETRPVPDDYYPALARQKHIYAGELRRWEQFNQHQQRLPMESLLLQGIHPPALTREDLLKSMDRIDRISLALFGRMEPVEPPQHHTQPLESGKKR